MRFIQLILLLAVFFTAPVLKAGACEMHHKTEKSAGTVSPALHNTKMMAHPANCCSQSPAAHQQKGHCTHDNCTDNSCHPVSIYSLHAVHQLDITELPVAATDYSSGINKMQLASYTYSIWQPPRLS
ncbi:hypothetical protein [Niabella drilacis]|uniref:Uncharacterized protein n=1 Tax=Niabella drilacis (strain DSM 25811 / CCM 8410 / CCUG 62505 / LMG 26954 / E90) TaxID=1285928 RepID=A0A1G6L7Z8_NIADE|nr:hypothetical protein [Niabella drilacis]SDC39419.1 hypothetical protein SAMN04487894_102254 [Niabella drilacis]